MKTEIKIQKQQKITLKAEIAEQNEEIILKDCEDNSDYVEISNETNEPTVIHKDMIDSVIRALAKFNP
jgi:hypothetical protein